MKAFIAALLLSIFLLPGVVSAEESKEEYIITFKEGAKTNIGITKEDFTSVVSEGGKVKEVIGLGILVAELTETQAEEMKQKENVLYVNKNETIESHSITMASNSYAITRINPHPTWDFYTEKDYSQEYEFTNKFGFTGKGVNIAILDTGIGVGEDLPDDIPSKNIKARVSCYKETPDKEGETGEKVDWLQVVDEGISDCDETATDIQSPHATQIADIIIGKHNNVTFDGIAPDAGIYSISYKKPENEPMPDSSQLDDSLRGLVWVYNHNRQAEKEDKIHIVNMSFTNYNVRKPEIQKVIKDLYDSGVLLIAGTGNEREKNLKNDEEDYVGFPAAYDYVIAVGALNQSSRPSAFSQQGHQLDIMAPGEDFRLATPNKYDSVAARTAEQGDISMAQAYDTKWNEAEDDVHGTSVATPIVVSVAALLKEQYPEATASDLEWMLLYKANGKSNEYQMYDWGVKTQLTRTNDYGYGMVNAMPFEERADSRGYRKDGVGYESNILYSIDADQIIYSYPSEKAPKMEYGENGMTRLVRYWGFFKSSTEDSQNAKWAQLESGEWIKQNSLTVGAKFYLFNDTYIYGSIPRATMPAGTITITHQSDGAKEYRTDYEYDGKLATIKGDSGSTTPFKNVTKEFRKTSETKAYYQPDLTGYPEEVDIELPTLIKPDKIYQTFKKEHTWYRLVTDEGIVWLNEDELEPIEE